MKASRLQRVFDDFLRLLSAYVLGGAKPRVRAHVLLMHTAKRRGLTRLAKWLEARLQIKYGVFISHRATYAKSLELKHPVGIVVGEGVRIGERVTLFQNVTLGGARRGDGSSDRYPTIEDEVTIFAGAVVIGKIVVGRGSTVGANSVVTRDVPPFSTVAGSPARIIRSHTSTDSGIKH